MEGNPPRTDFIEAVAQRTKLPPEAFSSFLLHAKVDPRHRADLDCCWTPCRYHSTTIQLSAWPRCKQSSI